jgi:hypothetical protein
MPPGALDNNFSGSEQGGGPAARLPTAGKDDGVGVHHFHGPGRVQAYVRGAAHQLILQQRLHTPTRAILTTLP